MNSLYRLLKILDIFDDQAAVVGVEQMSVRFGYTRSTLYRYLKVLTDRGLLTACGGNGFSLGPRVVELHARMHAVDPFLVSGRVVAAHLSAKTKGFSLLCRRYRDRVLCVHSAVGVVSAPPHISSGHYCNVARHPQGRVILAGLPAVQVRRLHKAHLDDFISAGLGDGPAALRSALRQVRDRGYDIERDLDGTGVGIVSVPILDASESVIGSLSLGTDSARLTDPRVETLVKRLEDSARNITDALLG